MVCDNIKWVKLQLCSLRLPFNRYAQCNFIQNCDIYRLTVNRENEAFVFNYDLKLATFIEPTLNTKYALFMRISCRIGGICVFGVAYIKR